VKVKGFSDLLGSERGVFCVLALIVASLMVATGKLTPEMWLDFMKYLTGALVASKTVTTAVQHMKKPPEVEVPPARVVSE
jgi:hypothetical protein